MLFKDYYKILEINSIKVDTEDIKIAYRNQAKKYHPDRNKDYSEERIKDINEAYKILSNPTTKRKYDRKWRAYVERKKPSNQTYKTNLERKSFKEEVMNMFFGNLFVKKDKTKTKEKTQAKKGENLRTQINIRLKDGYLGNTKYLNLRTQDGNIQKISIKIPRGIKQNDKIRIVGYGKQR